MKKKINETNDTLLSNPRRLRFYQKEYKELEKLGSFQKYHPIWTRCLEIMIFCRAIGIDVVGNPRILSAKLFRQIKKDIKKLKEMGLIE